MALLLDIAKNKAIAEYIKKANSLSSFNKNTRPYSLSDILEYPENFNEIGYSYIYCTRIYCRQGFQVNNQTQYYCYSIGQCDSIPQLITSQLNTEYESRANNLPTNLLFCFLIKINKTKTTVGILKNYEEQLRAELNDYLIDNFSIKYLNNKSFSICLESYGIIEKFIETNFNKNNYWISEKYGINDNIASIDSYGDESFDGNYLGNITEHNEYINDTAHDISSIDLQVVDSNPPKNKGYIKLTKKQKIKNKKFRQQKIHNKILPTENTKKRTRSTETITNHIEQPAKRKYVKNLNNQFWINKELEKNEQLAQNIIDSCEIVSKSNNKYSDDSDGDSCDDNEYLENPKKYKSAADRKNYHLKFMAAKTLKNFSEGER